MLVSFTYVACRYLCTQVRHFKRQHMGCDDCLISEDIRTVQCCVVYCSWALLQAAEFVVFTNTHIAVINHLQLLKASDRFMAVFSRCFFHRRDLHNVSGSDRMSACL